MLGVVKSTLAGDVRPLVLRVLRPSALEGRSGRSSWQERSQARVFRRTIRVNALIVDETAVNTRDEAGWCVASLVP